MSAHGSRPGTEQLADLIATVMHAHGHPTPRYETRGAAPRRHAGSPGSGHAWRPPGVAPGLGLCGATATPPGTRGGPVYHMRGTSRHVRRA